MLKLEKSDMIKLSGIVESYINSNGSTGREAEYPEVLRLVAEGMSWDDAIVTDGQSVNVVHG